MSKFDPTPYLIAMGKDKKGKEKMYLQTAHRVLWFRTEHPVETGWAVLTEVVQLAPYPVVTARVVTPEGVVVVTSHGSAQPKAGSVYSGRELEKAETAAIGRALGLAGFGSQFDEEDEGNDLADTPVVKRGDKPAPKSAAQPAQPKPLITEAEWTAFAAHWKAKENLTNADMCNALNVDDLRQFTGSLANAHGITAQWCIDNHAPEEEAAPAGDAPPLANGAKHPSSTSG